MQHVFDRSGLAALSDLQTSEWKKLFVHMENEQEEFLSKETQFRSKEYKWPRDSLHTWSRVWEYPYVYHHLKLWYSKYKGKGIPHLMDFGSGITFFPFSLARLGMRLTCTDIDPICERDFSKAIKYIPHGPGIVDFRLSSGKRIPFSDGEIDVAYCISVLEHIPTFEIVIAELGRVIKNDGLLILTIDLDLRGDSDLGVKAYKRLTAKLQHEFYYLYPEVTIHPSDLLHSGVGPYGTENPSGFKLAKYILKQRIIKPFLGREPNLQPPYHLTVLGLVMKKR